MSYHVLHNDGYTLLATDRPIVKAHERQPIGDAILLLDRLKTEGQRRDAGIAAAESEARERGYREGYDSGRRDFVEAVTNLAAQHEADRRQREQEIASLALAALRQIAGEIGDAETMQGVALRAARAVVPQGPVTIDVSPTIAVEVEAGLARVEGEIVVRADPDLGERQCRVSGPDSRIIADLDRQFDEVAERWGAPAHVD
ncbi:flagellar biosynthesis/type III secretory pathway protein FliH [Sphingomonas zeicaulis]|uniref:FliH/SctL family protein n=1 Tax=Sphingomonas zeicaulis TaxID=1632740 RepID=UPI003D2036D3